MNSATQKLSLLLDEYLPYKLSVLSNTISGEIASSYSQRFGLSIPAWRVMALLGRYPNQSAADLVKRSAMDKVAISRAVSSLTELNYITREVHDDDKRRSILNLSEQGVDIYNQIVPLAREYESKLLAQFDDAETHQLNTLLLRLKKAAESLND